MPRMNEQKARGSVRCTVVEDGSVYACGKSKRAHSDAVKRPVAHTFGGPNGTDIEVVWPKCGACQRVISKGETYRYWKPRHGAKQTRCVTCPPPSRSSMTGSEILGMAWDIADADYTADTREELEDLQTEVAEQIGDIVDGITEKLDNIEAGMGHPYAPVYEELDERRGEYEAWQQEVEGVDFDQFEGEGDDVCADCGMAYSDGDHEVGDDGRFGPDGHYFEEDEDEAFDVEGALAELQQAIDACPE